MSAAFAVGGRTRSASLAQVPTFLESGIGGFEAGLWFGLNAPAATSWAIVERLNRKLDRVLATAEVRAQLGAQSIEPTPSSIEVSFGRPPIRFSIARSSAMRSSTTVVTVHRVSSRANIR